MTIEMVAQVKKTGKIYDISDLVESVTWTTAINEQPGKMEFTFKKDKKFPNINGSVIRFKYKGKGIFFGYFFKYGKTKELQVTVTAYDQLRYLAFNDTLLRNGRTVTEFFADICKSKGFAYKVAAKATYKLSAKLFDDKSLFTMLDQSIDETIAFNNQWFVIYDDFGALTINHINQMKTKVVIGDGSYLTDYSFEASIDDDTFNIVKLSKENDKTKKRDVYIVKDSNAISNWGSLQYFKTITEDISDAQIKQLAERTLAAKNRETKTLSLNCLGHTEVRSGSGVVLSIPDLVEDGIKLDSYVLVTGAEHTFDIEGHTMKLEVLV